MSRKQRDILNGLRQLGRQPLTTYAGRVVEVGSEHCTVDVDGFTYYEVRLRAAVNGDKSRFIVFPKPGSWVLISRIEEGDDFFVSMVSEVESIVLAGDEYGGLVKVEALVNRLNAIENAFNSFLKEYKLHVHGGVTVGNGVTLVMTPVSAQQNITSTERSALENEKIKHG